MVRLPILLSRGFTPVVKLNDQVSAGQVISSKAASREYIVSITGSLSVSIEKARKCLRKNPGDIVKVGDVLAVKRGLWGFNEEKVVARVEGKIVRYERQNGNLVIQELPADGKVGGEDLSSLDGVGVVSPVDGIVVVCNNDMIVISTEKDVYSGIKGVGENVIGEVFILEDAFLQRLGKGINDISLYYSLGSSAVGKIIVGGNFSRELLIKSIGMGAIGIVGTNISDEDIEYLSKRHMVAPIIEVDYSIIERILQWKDKKIYLNSPEKQILFLHV